MKFNIQYFFACTFLAILNVTQVKSQEIKIGQKCPEVFLKNIINYDRNEIRLSDFKSKLVILDFWSTSCSACIQAFSKIDSLQNQFKDQLQFIAVNGESYESTINFFRKKSHIKKPPIPFVAGDTILSRLFPHIFVPHHVWINKAGIVQYITDGHNATAEHINAFVNGDSLALHEKKYDPIFFYESPLMALTDKKGIENLESYSLLMHCLSGISFGNAVGNSSGTNNGYHITQTCASILQLYTMAFSEDGKHDFSNSNTVILKVKDKSKYHIPTDNNLMDEWVSNYSYNYELMVPATESKEIYKKMQQDLSRYFNLKAVVEKRMIKCLALVRIITMDKLKTKAGKPATNFWVSTTDSIRYMTNQDFELFANALSAVYQDLGFARPLIKKTYYKGKIDIQLSADAFNTFDVAKLNIELYRYGLALQEQSSLREVLIIREAK